MSIVTKLEIKRETFSNGFKSIWVVQYHEDGTNYLAGAHVKTEDGAYRVLKRCAKKFKLTVTGDTAQ